MIKFKWYLQLGLFLTLQWLPSAAQTTQFLPEIDTYLQVEPKVRFLLQAKQTREGGDPTQAELGPSVDFLVKPLVRLRRVVTFDLDESKSRALVLSAGYRYLTTGGGKPDNRILASGTFNLPLKTGLLISDRNRGEFNPGSDYYWRYRNRVSLQRTVTVHSYHPTPYIRAEFYYDSRYHKWSDTALYGGCLFPIRRHLEIESYYDHQNSTGESPNQQLNQLGLIFNLYFEPR
jgi:Protein of unknown function (DUF2490)